MKTLEAQLQALAEQADQSMPWVSLSEIIPGEEIVERPPLATDRRPRSWLVAGAAAAAVVVVLSLPLLWRAAPRGSVSEPVPSTSPGVSVTPTTVQPEPAATTSSLPNSAPEVPAPPAILQSELEWAHVPTWTGPMPQWISEYPGGAFVASGYGVAPRYSTDGMTWNDVPPGLFDSARDVYVAGRYAVADATTDSDLLGDGPSPWPGRSWLGAKWERLLHFDGETWNPIELPSYVNSTPLINAAPVVSGSTVLIQLEFDLHGGRYALSRDGGPFELHNGPPSGHGLTNLPQVIALGTGFAVYDEIGTFWTSSDGEEWTVTADLREQASERPTGRPYVIGFSPYRQGAVGQVWSDNVGWVTSDGMSFTEFTEPVAEADDQGVRYLTPADEHLILGHLSRTPQFWALADGQEWLPLPAPAPRPAQSGPDPGRLAITPNRLFYWYSTGNGDVVMQVAAPTG